MSPLAVPDPPIVRSPVISTVGESNLIPLLLSVDCPVTVRERLPPTVPIKSFLATISILGVAKTVTLVVLIAPVLVLALPIFDTLFAIIRRIVKGKSLKAVFQADKGHLHHRLMKRGFSQKQAVTILYGASATLGMFAVILIDDGIWKALSFALIVIAIIAIGYKELKNFKNEEIKSMREYRENMKKLNSSKDSANDDIHDNVQNTVQSKRVNNHKKKK